ncbi:MAG: hypothetical protein R6U92_02775 [Bacillota bacterium]
MEHRRLGLRIPPRVHERLRWESFKSRRSINSIVLEAIEQYLGGDKMLRGILKHRGTGNAYAITMEGDEITGAFGPIFSGDEDIDPTELKRVEFEENPELVEWIKSHDLDFERLEEYDIPEDE